MCVCVCVCITFLCIYLCIYVTVYGRCLYYPGAQHKANPQWLMNQRFILLALTVNATHQAIQASQNPINDFR